MISGAKKFGVRLLVGILVLAMAAFGLENLFLRNNQAVLEINGDEVYQPQLDNAIRQYRLSLANIYGQDFVDTIGENFVVENAQNQLIQQVLLRQEVDRLALSVDDNAVNTHLLTIPAFQGDNGFSVDALNSLLSANRMSLVEFQNNIRVDLAQELMVDSLTGTSVIHSARLNGIANILFNKRNLLYARIQPDQLKNSVQPSQVEIAQYYDDNSSDFMEKEQASFDYIHLQLDDFIDENFIPNEQDIKFAYQNYLAERSQQQKYEVAHILIATDDMSDQDALAQVNDLSQRIMQGEDFAELAKIHSQDPGSAANGGSLGQVELDSLVPEFADQVRLMQPGDISPPVQSDFGYHIIRLDSTPSSDAPTIEERRPFIITQLREQQAEDSYTQSLQQLTNLLPDADSLESLANTLSLTIATTPLLNQQGPVRNVSQEVFSDSQVAFLSLNRVLSVAFSDEVIQQGNISQLVEIHAVDSDQSAQALVLARNEYIAPRQLPFDEVREQVIEVVKSRMASEIAKEITDSLFAEQQAIQSHEDIADFLQNSRWRNVLPEHLRKYDIQWNLLENFTRYSTEPIGLASEVFRQPPSVHTLHSSQDGTYVYIETASELPEFAELTSEQRTQLFQTLSTDTTNVLGSSYLSYLRDNANIWYN